MPLGAGAKEADSKVEDTIRIFIKNFREAGYFEPYSHAVLPWHRGDEVFSLEFWTYPDDRIELSFNGISQTIGIAYSENYQGRFSMFECPKCKGRKESLALLNDRFYCMSCHGLTYRFKRSEKIPARRGAQLKHLAKPREAG